MEDTMNTDLDNRWSDAARLAALAVRKARAMLANPRKANPAVKKGKQAPKPSLYVGASATFDERTGKRNIPEKNIWIPPPDSHYWKDTKWVEDFKKTVAENKKTGITNPKFPNGPNIFYSSTGPKGPLDESKLGYTTGTGKQPMPPMPPKKGGSGTPQITDGIRYIIGGKRYTKIGNKLVPDEKPAPGQKTKVFYQK
jgi:hypothetical protein